MLSILIIDDTEAKRSLLKSFLKDKFEELRNTVFDEAVCTNEGLAQLCRKQYDLVLLDLYITIKKNDNRPDPQNAATLLSQIHELDIVKKPSHILGITRMKVDEIKEDQKHIFDDNLWALLQYDDMTNGWQERLTTKIEYLIRAKKQLYSNPQYMYDVAIFNALGTPENEWVKKLFGNNWTKIEHPFDKCNNYYQIEFKTHDEKNIRIVTCTPNIMGASAAAMITTKMQMHFRPKYMFMTGISAAADNDGGKVNFGDIIIATEAIDKGNGKFLKEGTDIKFVPDPKSFHTQPLIISIADDLKQNKGVLRQIKDDYPIPDFAPASELSIITGQVGSVPAVVANEDIVGEMMYHNRYLSGIEMEAYGMYLAACYGVEPTPKAFASLKSVSDFADQKKGNYYRNYAAYTSAALLKYIVENKLEY